MMKESPEIEEALEAFLTGVTRITEKETVPLSEAAGRVLAEDISAPFSVPSFPKSAMDGYAVRSEEVMGASKENPVILRVAGERLAGEDIRYFGSGDSGLFLKSGEIREKESGGNDADVRRRESDGMVLKPLNGNGSELPPGTALRIMTGAEVPAEYDAVVREEDTDYGETEVRICKGAAHHQNYCAVGEDIREGDVVLPAGTRLGRIGIGTLASLGIGKVTVQRRLRVRIISTGTELADVEDGKLPEGKIYNSIAYMLEASLGAAGFAAEHVICPDEADQIASAIRTAAEEADVMITTGGVSVGKKDLLPAVLEELGAEIRFRRARIQPGTPTIGSTFQGKAILSLSGNPYAAAVNFDLYFWPLAAKLTGSASYLPVTEEAVLDSPYEKVNVMRRLLRARVEQGRVTLPAKSHASSVLSNLLSCNCYLDLPAGTKVKPGDRVMIRRMPE